MALYLKNLHRIASASEVDGKHRLQKLFQKRKEKKEAVKGFKKKKHQKPNIAIEFMPTMGIWNLLMKNLMKNFLT